MRQGFDYRVSLRSLAAVVAVLMLALAAGPAAARSDGLSIALGGQKILKLDNAIGRIAVSDPKVVDIKVISSRELRLLGQNTGSSDLTVWFSGNDKSVSYRIVVGADLGGLQGALSSDPSFAQVTATNTGKTTVLRGKVYSLADRERVKELALGYVGKDVRNMVDVAEERMVAVEIRFAAVQVNTLKALGLNFRTLGGNFEFASTSPGASAAGYTSGSGLNLDPTLPIAEAFNLYLSWPGSNNFLGVISALNSANLAQLLAEPTLLVRSGEEANFLAGGEIPIPVPQSGSTNGAITIEYKKFGVQLNVQATVLDNDRIVMKVNPEVSELDFNNAITIQGSTIPALLTRSTNTTVELGDGQSFVLAGLMYSSSSNVEDKVPGVGDLPIIGNFFKTSRNQQQRQELIVIATPRLVSPMAAGTVPKLPGEGIPKYDPSTGKMLLNDEQLEDHVVKYGLMR
ncbi:type II and III secretion system protein family protein [Parvibaculum sp.]|uniref:type II and III secretion system protein family protein n=1 Tax=Parvibaculum sp. TaxID=2024848 RepID=UPI002CE75AD9|nr:type II and III secretion system protein family protein [Parvibaculum sp.]HUD51496.1 type II and III secretion system protein family protein [Parvibaculum sp.]